MAPGLSHALLVLDGSPLTPSWDSLSNWTPHRAASALEAAATLTRVRPDALVVHAGIGWHRSFVETLPKSRRPAVVAVGGTGADAPWADEWVAASASPEELHTRLALAQHRARDRRRAVRRTLSDPLTALPNRRGVLQELLRAAALRRRTNAPLSLVLIDLDDFKSVNTWWGHAGGDKVLRRIGAALRAASRSSEVCGRVGGDEFAVAVSGSEREARRAAERFCRAIRGCGLSATWASAELRPQERLQDLYRRAAWMLQASKSARRSPPRDGSGDGFPYGSKGPTGGHTAQEVKSNFI